MTQCIGSNERPCTIEDGITAMKIIDAFTDVNNFHFSSIIFLETVVPLFVNRYKYIPLDNRDPSNLV